MGNPAVAKDFGLRLLKALGVDTTRVRGFVLKVNLREPVTLIIDKIVEEPADATDLEKLWQETYLGPRIARETFELHTRQEEKDDDIEITRLDGAPWVKQPENPEKRRVQFDVPSDVITVPEDGKAM